MPETMLYDATQCVGYIPRWSEVAVTQSMVSVGFVPFALAVKYLPVFTHGHERPWRRALAGV